MDLMGGYLLVVMILFIANISLLLGNVKINNFCLAAISLAVLIVSFALMYVSGYLAAALSFLNDYFSCFFIAVSIVAFLIFLHYFRKNNLRLSLVLLIILYIISVVCLASQAKLSISDDLLYSLFGCLTLFLVYQITKLLVHAKRQYPVIIGEYVSLFSMLLFIFGLTYDSTRYLDYTAFTPFLILTPTYQLIYVAIGLIVVIIVGLLYNEHKGGSA